MTFTTVLELLALLLLVTAAALAAATLAAPAWSWPVGLTVGGLGALAASALVEWSVRRRR